MIFFDLTPIHVASRIAQDHDPIEAGSFVESDRIEKSYYFTDMD